jgi:hypothetical protein
MAVVKLSNPKLFGRAKGFFKNSAVGLNELTTSM